MTGLSTGEAHGCSLCSKGGPSQARKKGKSLIDLLIFQDPSVKHILAMVTF